MAVIRCPNCGKPNPDFLEVCQYCDASLHPAGAPASAAADDTLVRPPAPSAPPQNAPPQSPSAPSAPVPSSAPAPEPEPLDWMSKLRQAQSEAPVEHAADEPDWMWTGTSGESSAAPAPAVGQEPTAESAAVELPEWLRDLDEPTATTAPPPAPLVKAAEAAVPAGASTPSVPTTPAASATTTPPTASTPEPPSALRPAPPSADETVPPRPRRKLTDWLDRLKDLPSKQSRQPSTNAQTTPLIPNTDQDLPDWLKSMAPESGATTLASAAPEAAKPPAQPLAAQAPTPQAPAASGAIETPDDELPDWLKTLRAKSDEATAVPGTATLQGQASGGDETLPAVRRMQELPENLRTQAPAGTTPSVTAPEPASHPELVSDDMPDWLRGILSAQAPDAAPPAIGPAPSPASESRAATPPPAAMQATPPAPAATPAPPSPPQMPPIGAPVGAPSGADVTLAPPTRHGKRMTDWIGNVPATEGSAPAEQELPDWLTALSAETAAPAAQATPAAPAAPEPEETPAMPGTAPLTAEPSLEIAALQNAADQPVIAASSDEDLPDWLKAMRSEAGPAAESPAPQAAQAPPPSTEAAAPAAEDQGLPDWLKAITQAEVPAAFLSEAPAPAAMAQDATSQRAITPSEEEELPDWLRAITHGQAEPPVAASQASAAAAAVAGPAAPEAPPSAGEVAIPEPAAAAPAAPGDATIVEPSRPGGTPVTAAPVAGAPADKPTGAPGTAGLPAWLHGVHTGGLTELDAETLAWLQSSAQESKEPEAAPEPATLDLSAVQLPAEKPAWLDELAAATAKPSTPAPAAAGPAPTPQIAPTPEEDLPDWLRALRGQAAEQELAPEAMPDWLRALRGLPPAPVRPGGVAEPSGAAKPAGAQPAAASAPGLEQAALPAWLAAMRPVDIAKAEANEADSYQETLGVLAGMRGVLRAEPVVAQPRKATTQVHKLAVTDAQSANANMLAELLRAETAVLPMRRGRVQVSALIERWTVFALLALAIVLAQFQLPGLFAPASSALTPEAQAVYAAVEKLPANQPALVAFDYDAAQQGELDAGAQAVVGHLARHGSPIVAIGLRLTAPAVAEQVLSRTAASGYVNLGFIPGGPVGVLQFAADPRSLFSADFSGNASVWSMPSVAGVHRLSDFGLIVLISGAPESARAWVEQAHAFAADVPTVAVVSAGAEALVRPYYDDANITSPLRGQLPIKGLIVGLGGAAAYERATYTPGAAAALWPALGGGLLMAALLIVAGNIVFAVSGALRRRRA